MIISIRASVRRRRASIALVALVAALLFGCALGAFAGARRSSTAMDRFLAEHGPEDVYVQPPEDGSLDMAAVEHLPQVLGAMYQSYLALVPLDGEGRPQLDLIGSINPYLYSTVAGSPGAINRLRIVKGRDLDPAAPLEVVIDEELAAARGLSVGSHLPMQAYAASQIETVFSNEASGDQTPPPEGPVLDLTVVGITRMPVDIHPGEEEHVIQSGGTKDIYLTPALYERYGDDLALFGPPIPGMPEAIRLVRGLDDVDAFRAAVVSLPGGNEALISVSDSDALDSARTARRAISVETAALYALAAILAVSGLALVGHALARLARSATGELGVLRSIGLRPSELLAVTAAPGVIAMALGSLGAIVASLVASPLMPIGLGRQAEVSPGFDFDLQVVLGGAVVVVMVSVAMATLTAWPTVRAIGRERRAVRSTARTLADRLASAGAPLTPTIGARFAAGPRGVTRSAPLRTAMVAGAVAIVALTGVVTYNASLQRLSSSPAEQGAEWDLAIGNINLSDYSSEDAARLAADPNISGVAAAAAPQGRAKLNGLDVTLAGFDTVSGGVAPRMLSGRLPTSVGEIALGQATAERLHLRVGEHLTVVSDLGTTRDVELVGTALLSASISPTMQIGDGALVSIDQLRELIPDQPVTYLLATVKPGISVDDAIQALEVDWGRNVARPVRAGDVVNLERVKGIPVALALGLGAGAVLLLVFALMLSVRERRLDLGVLRAIGATRRQLSSALTWQALWLYLGAALVAVPLGLIAGRLVWRRIADDMGVQVAPVVPLAQVVVIIVAGLAVVIAIVVLPARAATRQTPSAALRTE